MSIRLHREGGQHTIPNLDQHHLCLTYEPATRLKFARWTAVLIGRVEHSEPNFVISDADEPLEVRAALVAMIHTLERAIKVLDAMSGPREI